jgi:hypothetical protein
MVRPPAKSRPKETRRQIARPGQGTVPFKQSGHRIDACRSAHDVEHIPSAKRLCLIAEEDCRERTESDDGGRELSLEDLRKQQSDGNDDKAGCAHQRAKFQCLTNKWIRFSDEGRKYRDEERWDEPERD